MNISKYTAAVFFSLTLAFGVTSCSDFFDVESNYIIDADKNHLSNATDTIYSVTGILNKVQAIADRTILLGEARGDLMTVTESAASDLRDVANFNVGDDNMYNQPSDYYAIINNCNYFLANADTTLRNNRDEYLFRKEYAAVKGIRAWTYLQLVTTYGKVPFVTTPILSQAQAEQDFPMYDIKQVCDYFINEDGLDKLVEYDLPGYEDIKSLPSKWFYFPIRVVLGDLNLWAGNYLKAAKYYHDYILCYKGNTYKINPISSGGAVQWNSSSWLSIDRTGWTSQFSSSAEKYTDFDNELITMIPMDSIPSEGHYSQLRSLFNTSYSDDYKVSLVPSKSLINLSESQTYCYNNQGNCEYVPSGLEDHRSGDLRLAGSWMSTEATLVSTGDKVDYQSIYKYSTKNVHVYRKSLIYLRLAEAMNRAGYPHYAYSILSTGVNTQIITDSIAPHYTQQDSTILVSNFDFPCANFASNTYSNYILYTDPLEASLRDANTIGFHSRGCGFTPANEFYKMPQGTLEEQMKAVEDLIVDEEALEFAFEGYRYYDLLRVALRRTDDPSYLYNKIQTRKGAASDPSIVGDLKNKANWFLNWNGKIGY